MIRGEHAVSATLLDAQTTALTRKILVKLESWSAPTEGLAIPALTDCQPVRALLVGEEVQTRRESTLFGSSGRGRQ